MAGRNLYDVLQVSPTATHDEIKRSYQNLVLKHHPDKAQSASNDTFIEIDEAWKVLRDAEKRKQYDAELGQARFDDKPIVHETLRKSDFDFDAESETFYRDCRCGGVYVMPDDDGGTDDSIYIACDECSLVIELEKG
ncbi:dnaJ homolog subfamily C member 24-like [Culicoides brevitarsis]|uniref:dnaJ homolog subfamily C member 24-like n=1 Tax=Culicoides brevitarsis TaxID=469753 RepID=UPI00307C92D9